MTKDEMAKEITLIKLKGHAVMTLMLRDDIPMSNRQINVLLPEACESAINKAHLFQKVWPTFKDKHRYD